TSGIGALPFIVNITSGLVNGINNANIMVSSPTAINSPLIIPVNVTFIPPPEITVNQSVLNFQINESTANAQTVLITNTGGGALNWYITKTSSWIKLDKLSGTAPSSLL